MHTEKHYLEQLINTANNFNELIDLVVHVCAGKVNAEKCSLMLLDEKGKTLSIVRAKGINKYVIRNTKVKIGEGSAGFVALSGETLLVADKKNEAKSNLNEFSRYKNNSFISIPLKAKTVTIGVLNLSDKIDNQNFTEKDLNSISTFVSFASIAIKNALMFKELKKLSITDELTGLYNRRYFGNCLENEIERSSRYDRYFTLALLDIDNFKYFNDTYGHMTGDIILNQISKVFKTYTRSIDVVARYGGEEFAVTFQEPYGSKGLITSATSSGLQFIERLRIVVENHEFSDIDSRKKFNITISGGVAVFPFDGTTSTELISKADENLYLAKRKGRNRVCVSREHLPENNEKIQNNSKVYGSDDQFSHSRMSLTEKEI